MSFRAWHGISTLTFIALWWLCRFRVKLGMTNSSLKNRKCTWFPGKCQVGRIRWIRHLPFSANILCRVRRLRPTLSISRNVTNVSCPKTDRAELLYPRKNKWSTLYREPISQKEIPRNGCHWSYLGYPPSWNNNHPEQLSDHNYLYSQHLEVVSDALSNSPAGSDCW